MITSNMRTERVGICLEDSTAEKGAPMNRVLSRREMMGRCGVCLGAGAATVMAPAATPARAGAAEAPGDAKSEPFPYCLNMATIRGKGLPLVEEVEIAAQAGY